MYKIVNLFSMVLKYVCMRNDNFCNVPILWIHFWNFKNDLNQYNDSFKL